MRRKMRLEKILPKYAWLPLVLAFTINNITYFLSRPFTTPRKHYSIVTPIDEVMPFVPAFIIVYLGAYLFWIIGYLRIANGGKQLCLEMITADIIAKLICLVIFLVVPTEIASQEVTGSDIFSKATEVLYSLDARDNLFPSVHCLESWLCFRGVARIKNCSVGFKAGCFMAAVAIFVSTLLVKQHLFLDVIGGIAVVEIGLFLTRRFSADRLLDRLNRKFHLE